MVAELDLDKELDPEDFEPTYTFQPGDVVCVIREFLSYDSLRIWLKTNMKGQVVEIDSDGDMRVRFPCCPRNCTTWNVGCTVLISRTYT